MAGLTHVDVYEPGNQLVKGDFEVVGNAFVDTTLTAGTGGDDVPQLILTPSAGTGAPDAGAHVAGEIYLDAIGGIYVCTVAGSPGTWVAGSIGGAATATSLAVSGDTTTATLETTGNADIGGTLGVDGAATFDTTVTVVGAFGCNGASAQTAPTISGPARTGTLAQLQTAVGLLLDALEASGLVVDTTT